MSEDKYKKYKRDLYAWRRDHGICTICGKAAAVQNTRLCAACAQHEKERFERKYKTDGEYREKIRKNNLSRYSRCVSDGLCVQCGRRKAIKGHRRCEECAEYQRIASRKSKKEVANNDQ